jgi:RNA polymerase sigma-B factor
MSQMRSPEPLNELDPEAEVALLARAGDGDRDAVAAVVRRYMPVVERIARRYHSPGGLDDVDDLIQVGVVGLLEALSRFVPDRGSFAAFASTTISGTIKRHFRDRGWRLRIPRSLHDASLRLNGTIAELESRLGRAPSDEELARASGIDRELVGEARVLMRGANPLPLHGDGSGEGVAVEDVVGDEDPGFGRAELRDQLSRLCERLDPRDREVLALRFGLDRTQVEIARQVGVSQMQVSRLLRRALGTMSGESDRAA